MANQTKILITGGTGFAGSHLIAALKKKEYQNIHVTHFASTQNAELGKEVVVHQLNLTDKSSVAALIKEVQPEQIYHLASFAAVGKSFQQASMILENNITLQLNVLEAMREHAPKARLLSIGSAEEYGLVSTEIAKAHRKINEETALNPVNPYAVSKVAQDLLANAYFLSFQLDIVRVRPFNHIGENQSPDFVIPAFASQIVKIEKDPESKLKVGNLESIRDFTDVKDMVQAYIVLMEKGRAGTVYNIGSGRGVRIKEVLETLLQLANQPIQVEEDPSRLRPSDVPYFVADITKIRELGWEPKIELSHTLERVLNEWRSKA